VCIKIQAIYWYALAARILSFGGVVGSGALRVKCKKVLLGVCSSRNAFFFTMNRRASAFELLSRGE
jgi:hypothetical protein